jgi:hypothetical protein
VSPKHRPPLPPPPQEIFLVIIFATGWVSKKQLHLLNVFEDTLCVSRTFSYAVLFPIQRLYFAGCGNGKYLSVNPSVFKIGVDRCCTLTETAREKEHEVHSTRAKPCSSVYQADISFTCQKWSLAIKSLRPSCFTQVWSNHKYILPLSILGLGQLTRYTD